MMSVKPSPPDIILGREANRSALMMMSCSSRG